MHPCGTFLGQSYETNTGFPGGSDGTESNVVDLGSVPGSGRSPGEGNGNSLQYSWAEDTMDRGAWWATVHGLKELDTTEQPRTCRKLIHIIKVSDCIFQAMVGRKTKDLEGKL